MFRATTIYRRGLPLLIRLVLGAACLHAQGTPEDYRRAGEWNDRIKNKLYYAPATFNWSDEGHRCWYMQQTPQGKAFVLVDADKRTKTPAFDHSRLAAALTTLLQRKVSADALPFNTFEYMPQDTLEFTVGDTLCRCSAASYACRIAPREKKPNSFRYWGEDRDELANKPVTSPDSNWVAFIRNYNVYIRQVRTQQEYQLSYDGSEGEFYSSFIEWSPDSKKLATNKVRRNTKHLLYLVESSPEDQLQPRLQTRSYLKPGDALPVKTPQLFLVDGKKQLPVDAALFGQLQYRLSDPEWRKDSRAITFEYNQRGHQVYRVLEADAQTGAVKMLIEEKSPTFIDYSGKRYRYDVNDGKEIIWASERDGWNHLYLYDGATGQVKNQITKGEWVVRQVIKVDEQARTIIFAGSGRETAQDPYLVQYYKTDFEGRRLQPLTNGNAQHSATFSPDHKYFIDVASRVDLPPATVLRDAADGKVLMELEKADISALQQTGWRMPEVFSAKGRDGKTDIWGIILRPSNFDPAKKYPVIEDIYAGPHSSFVPKSFRAAYPGMQELAELGFIVVKIDGMGTSNRSKAFHDVCWKNLKDAGFPDRILWMKAAAAKYPYMDITRVGVYGTSAGGQSAAGAVLFHPEFYKAAVASCGCHDNRMDKMWWNEQWMGYPIGPHYAECSNVTNAWRLQGKLLLILGELDDNVDPSSTLQLVNALIKANKDFDFLMVPGMGHSSGGTYGDQKRRDFFVRHLLGVAPPERNQSTVNSPQSTARTSP